MTTSDFTQRHTADFLRNYMISSYLFLKITSLSNFFIITTEKYVYNQLQSNSLSQDAFVPLRRTRTVYRVSTRSPTAFFLSPHRLSTRRNLTVQLDPRGNGRHVDGRSDRRSAAPRCSCICYAFAEQPNVAPAWRAQTPPPPHAPRARTHARTTAPSPRAGFGCMAAEDAAGQQRQPPRLENRFSTSNTTIATTII